MLPFPNDYFRTTTADGTFKLNFQIDTFPTDMRGKTIDPSRGTWNELHGFSVFPAITTYFSRITDNDLGGCAHWWDIEKSTLTSSPIVIVDSLTGKIVPHWVELDHSSNKTDISGKRALLVWPSTALDFDRRYIVGIRTLGKITPDTASKSFQALRDNSAFADVDSRRSHFEDIFARLDAVGFQRSSLVLAWDFTTNDKQDVTSRITIARDDALKQLGEEGPEYKILSVDYDKSDLVSKNIKGQFRMPLYLTTEEAVPSARLNFDANGAPKSNGFAWFDFEVIVPKAFTESPHSAGE